MSRHHPHAPTHVAAEAEHLSASQRQKRLQHRLETGEFADALSPLEDDLDALALGPTGSDGAITDPDIARTFKEEQLGHGEASARDRAWQQVRAHAGLDVGLRNEDVSASLEDASLLGEEQADGSIVAPDARDIDEIGRAVGLHYQDNEPLDLAEKVDRRDAERWELDPASAEDWSERLQEEEREVRHIHPPAMPMHSASRPPRK